MSSKGTTKPPTDSVGPQSTPSKENPNEESLMSLPPKIEPSPKHKRERTTCKPDSTPLWKFILEFGAVAVGIVVAFIYYYQLGAMQGQLSESQQSMYLAQRPWLGLEDGSGGGIQTGPLTIDEHGVARVDTVTRVKNFGQYAAQNVGSYSRLVIGGDVYKVSNQVCELGGQGSFPYVLFPGKDDVVSRDPAVAVPQEIVPSKDGMAIATLVGCIFFKDQFGYQYHFRYIYELRDPSNNMQPLRFKPEPKTVIGTGIFTLYSSSIDVPDYSKTPTR